MRLYLVGDSSWDERTLTWNTTPWWSASFAGYHYNVPANAWYEIDVSQFVKNPGLHAFGLGTNDNADRGLFSLEGGYGAQLIVTSE